MFDDNSSNHSDPASQGENFPLSPLHLDVSGRPTISSMEIAKLTGKEHANVLRDIRRILPEAGIVAIKFEGYYIASNGKQNPCYFLPRFECDLVVSGYSAKYRGAIIKRWYELEAQLASRTNPGGLKPLNEQSNDEVLVTVGALLRVAEDERRQRLAQEVIALEEKGRGDMYASGYRLQTDNIITAVGIIEDQKEEIAELTPLAEAFRKLCDAKGLIPIGTMGNMLGVGPGIIFTYLYHHYVLIEHGVRHKDPYGVFARPDYFQVKNVERTYIDKLGVLQKTTDKVTFATLKAADYVGRCLEITGIPDEKLKGRRLSKKLLLPLLP
jgi:phage regulator Rha-like protein/phage antirepressor YoqD-like protein